MKFGFFKTDNQKLLKIKIISICIVILLKITLTNQLKSSQRRTRNQRRTRRLALSLPLPVVNYLSSRDMRIHHYLFHQVRNQWNLLDFQSQQALRNLGWEPPRPARDRRGNFITNNNSGEDFLYMHRKMIEKVNEILTEQGPFPYGSRVVGWKNIPAPGDFSYPVPPAYWLDNQATTNIIRNFKSDSYFYGTMRRLENRFKNETVLRSMTLGQLGAYIEFQIHNPMHIRWSSSVFTYRRDPQPFWETDEIASEWDRPSYNWLNDFYASHVNSVFWKLHGWVDDRIEDWKRANGLTEIQWTGTWMGSMDMDHDHGDADEFLEKNKKVLKILKKSKNSFGAGHIVNLVQKDMKVLEKLEKELNKN